MHIYFSGVGGVGLGPLAEIARDVGYLVSGSDAAPGPMVEQLRATGITVNIGQDCSFMAACHAGAPIDWLVYSSALPDGHPELEFARAHHIRVTKRHELLAYIIDNKGLSLVAVAGTHGKTTTTAMLAWLCQQLGVPASYSIGATISFGPSGRYDPASQYFFYECDEYDRNFLAFHPNLALLTSVDYDHPDTFPTERDYVLAFASFVHQSQGVLCWPETMETLNLRVSSAINVPELSPAAIRLHGEHNRKNAALAVEAIHRLTSRDHENLVNILAGFPGTSRRFEKLADNLYSDYGHHPVEIAAVLQMARELSPNVVLVYQPHQNRRQHELKDSYTDCMRLAERVYWLPTYLSREDPALEILPPEVLSRQLDNSGSVIHAELDESLWQAVKRERYEGKLVIAMGAGSIDAWFRDHLKSEASNAHIDAPSPA